MHSVNKHISMSMYKIYTYTTNFYKIKDTKFIFYNMETGYKKRRMPDGKPQIPLENKSLIPVCTKNTYMKFSHENIL